MIKKYSGILVGLLTLLIHVLSKFWGAQNFYSFYSSTIFRGVRYCYDFTFGLLPFPSIYLFVGLLLLLFFFTKFRSGLLYFKINGPKKFVFRIFIWLANLTGMAIFLFYFLWGFNYYRPTIETELQLNEVNIDSNVIVTEFLEVSRQLNNSSQYRPNFLRHLASSSPHQSRQSTRTSSRHR